MPVLRGCSTLVIRCFKRVEHFADWITGAAGPVFVFLAWTLIIGGGLVFFDTVARDLSWPLFILLCPALVLIPLNMYGQYYLVTHVPPGYPSSRALAKSAKPLPEAREERWIRTGPGHLWRPERWGMYKRAGSWTGAEPDADTGRYKTQGARSLETTRHALSGAGKRSEGSHEGELRKGRKTQRIRRCRKCDAPKPERTHHCSVCKRCVLLMDHHCPWINGCVGVHNQRHFVLFMTWLCIACDFFALTGWRRLWQSFLYEQSWTSYTPRIAYTLIYVLAVAMGIAVMVLLLWHLYMVSKGETSIESHDNAYLEGKAASEGLIYLNQYDLGRRRNLQLFFNLGPTGYPLSTLLFPLIVPAASDGWSFPRRPAPPGLAGKVPAHRPAEVRAAESLALASSSGSGGGGVEGDVARAIHEASSSSVKGQARPQPGHFAEEGMGMSDEGGGMGRYVMGDPAGELTDDEEGGGGWMEIEVDDWE